MGEVCEIMSGSFGIWFTDREFPRSTGHNAWAAAAERGEG